MKFSKAKPAEGGSKRVDIAVPPLGYKNHLSIGGRHGVIRTWLVTDAARHDGAQLPSLLEGQHEQHRLGGHLLPHAS